MKQSSRNETPVQCTLYGAKDSAPLPDLTLDTSAHDVKVTQERAGFDTPAGTRGLPLPQTARPFDRFLNGAMSKRIVRQVFSLFRFNTLILTTIGRRSGTERSTVVCWFPGEDGSWLIVAAAGGTARNPAWYYNIAAHPDQVQIKIARRRVTVTAKQLHADERAEAWQQITAAARRFARFQRKTDRELPVIRLTPRSLPYKGPH